MENQPLEAAFSFDAADLHANRNGAFSEKQIQRFTRMDQSRRRGRVFAGGVFIGLAVAGLGAAVWLSSSDQELGLKLLFGFLFGLVCPVLCSAIGVYLLRVSSSKQHYKLGKVQGRIRFSRHINRRTRNPVYGYLVLHIATKRFSVPEHIPSIMRSGDEYLLYYITRAGSSTIVSATVVAHAA